MSALPPFRPAFTSAAQALRFGLLILVLLAAPALFARVRRTRCGSATC